MLRALTSGKKRGKIGSVAELYCTKDTDWANQKEWRIVGTQSGKYKYLKMCLMIQRYALKILILKIIY